MTETAKKIKTNSCNENSFSFSETSESIELTAGHEECHFLMMFRMKRAIDLLKSYEMQISLLKKELIQEKAKYLDLNSTNTRCQCKERA